MIPCLWQKQPAGVLRCQQCGKEIHSTQPPERIHRKCPALAGQRPPLPDWLLEGLEATERIRVCGECPARITAMCPEAKGCPSEQREYWKWRLTEGTCPRFNAENKSW